MQSNDNLKFLFLISDGKSTDIKPNVDYITEIRKNAETYEIIIISIFLTSKIIPKEEKLYDECQKHFSKGAKDLFLMSSTLTYEDPVIKFFIQKGWDIPLSGECKLFIEVNNSQNLTKFFDLFNEALGEANILNNSETPLNPNSLVNILASTYINDYVNSDVINTFKPNLQTGGTCYANAIAASICIASARVFGRPKLNFYEVLQEIIKKYGTNGGNVFNILNEDLPKYKLHFKKVDKNGAREAIMKTRPCVATFYLSAQQWGNFSKFYKENKEGVLTKEILNENNEYEDEKDGGHAVVLTHISKDYLTFLNSWGKEWGSNGYFKVKDADVLNMSFYDIFWFISDLSEEEIHKYNLHMQMLNERIKDIIYN